MATIDLLDNGDFELWTTPGVSFADPPGLFAAAFISYFLNPTDAYPAHGGSWSGVYDDSFVGPSSNDLLIVIQGQLSAGLPFPANTYTHSLWYKSTYDIRYRFGWYNGVDNTYIEDQTLAAAADWTYFTLQSVVPTDLQTPPPIANTTVLWHITALSDGAQFVQIDDWHCTYEQPASGSGWGVGGGWNKGG